MCRDSSSSAARGTSLWGGIEARAPRLCPPDESVWADGPTTSWQEDDCSGSWHLLVSLCCPDMVNPPMLDAGRPVYVLQVSTQELAVAAGGTLVPATPTPSESPKPAAWQGLLLLLLLASLPWVALLLLWLLVLQPSSLLPTPTAALSTGIVLMTRCLVDWLTSPPGPAPSFTCAAWQPSPPRKKMRPAPLCCWAWLGNHLVLG